MYRAYFTTGCGFGVVHASDNGIVKVDIPDVSRQEAVLQENVPHSVYSEITIHAAYLLQRYFQGERVDFSDIPVILDSLTAFQQQVLKVVRNLGYGEISTYRRVAELCGSPFLARAVGGALAANPIPIIIPCHRVVASDGRLTGFSAPGGEKSKRALLRMEEVEFKGVLVVKNQLLMHSVSN
jgi:methylated-DNA-[protein]-cysteine S-methyltransferase